jgi:uncharacterized membrane protein YcaP (DUF421 family)
MWTNMFELDISVLEKIVRPAIVYLFLVLSLRLAGKRELAQLNALDLVVLLTLSNTVQNAIIGNDNTVSGGLIGAATLLSINYVAVRFLFTHPRISHVVEGNPATLFEHGKIRTDVLQQELITEEELKAAAHKQGFASLAHVERAVLEPSGVISFVAKQPAPSQVRQDELNNRLDHISRQLAELQAAIAARK